jgi:hypothetical protein
MNVPPAQIRGLANVSVAKDVSSILVGIPTYSDSIVAPLAATDPVSVIEERDFRHLMESFDVPAAAEVIETLF